MKALKCQTLGVFHLHMQGSAQDDLSGGYRLQPNIINLHQIMGSILLLSVSGSKSSLSGGKQG